MAWRDELQPASFRGVPFLVDSDSGPVGRRTQLHEYPKRDLPLVEDMGRITREFKLVAWVAGPDCFQQRDALLKQLDIPGPGELVHPWYGRKTVTATACSVAHHSDKGGLVELDLSFVEGDGSKYPLASTSTSGKAGMAADSLQTSAQNRFAAAMEGLKQARVQFGAVQAQINAVRMAVGGYLAPVQALFGDARAIYDAIQNGPAQFAADVMRSVSSVTRLFEGFGGGSGLFGAVSLSGILGKTEAGGKVATVGQPVGADAVAFVRATQGLYVDALIVDSVRDVAALPNAVAPSPPSGTPAVDAQVGGTVITTPSNAGDVPLVTVGGEVWDLPASKDVQAVQQALVETIWTAARQADPSHYESLTDVRLAASRHLQAVGLSAGRLTLYMPPIPLPALVLAYRRYGDSTRAGEISARNRVEHPGFVPSVELELMKR